MNKYSHFTRKSYKELLLVSKLQETFLIIICTCYLLVKYYKICSLQFAIYINVMIFNYK